jgi:Ni,Fe-hydrogenase maturation factor
MKNKIKVFVLGNRAIKKDSFALEIAESLKKEIEGFEFIEYDPAESIEEKEKVIFLDVCKGIKKVRVLKPEEVERKKAITLHEHSFIEEILLLKKIGRIKDFKIIAIPIGKKKEKKRIKEELKDVLKRL